jgi:hypothetical protein
VTFDATARLACVVKRSREGTPLQALALLNDPVYVEMARALARRVLVERAGGSLDDQLRHAFRLCLVRQPTAAELAVLRTLHRLQSEASQADPERARKLVGSFALPRGVDAVRFAPWYAVATTLLNLDEMITRR